MKKTLNSLSGTLALPRAAAAQTIGVSTRTLDRLILVGAIRTVPAFRRRLITTKELMRFLTDGGYVSNTLAKK
jgi:hypothetical protein